MHRHNQHSPSSIPWTIFLAYETIRNAISFAWMLTLPLMWIAYSPKQSRDRRHACARVLLVLLAAKFLWECWSFYLGYTKWYSAIPSIAFLLNTAWGTRKVLEQ